MKILEKGQLDTGYVEMSAERLEIEVQTAALACRKHPSSLICIYSPSAEMRQRLRRRLEDLIPSTELAASTARGNRHYVLLKNDSTLIISDKEL